MFDEPKYIQAGVSLIFPRKPDIRRLANKLEDVVSNHYNQPTVLGVPDDFEAEVPRLLFDSRNGFSQLAISQVAMSMTVTFTPDYQVSSSLRRPYLEERIPLLFDLLEVCQISNPCFVGLNWRVRIEAIDALDDQVMNALGGHLLSDRARHSLFDVEVKRVEVLESKYFFNIAYTNYRQWHSDTQTVGIVRRSNQAAVGRGIQIQFDFNDRFSFNESPTYHTGVGAALEILSKAHEISDATLRDLLEDVG